MPKTRVDFWRTKFEQNVARDRGNDVRLLELGWSVVTIWECETKRPEDLRARLEGLFKRS